MTPTPTPTAPAADRIALRALSAADRNELDRLSGLDSAVPMNGGLVLGAEADGRLVAAISIDDGAVVADPFSPSSQAIELLRLRAIQLGAQPERRPGRLRRVLDTLRSGPARAGLAGSPPGAGGRLLEL